MVGAAVAARLPVDHLRAFERVALSIVLTLDTLPAATEYEIRDETGSRVAFAMRRARPALALELGF